MPLANCWIRYQFSFSWPQIRLVFNGTEAIAFLCPKIWYLFRSEIKRNGSANASKNQLRVGIILTVCEDCAKIPLLALTFFIYDSSRVFTFLQMFHISLPVLLILNLSLGTFCDFLIYT